MRQPFYICALHRSLFILSVDPMSDKYPSLSPYEFKSIASTGYITTFRCLISQAEEIIFAVLGKYRIFAS